MPKVISAAVVNIQSGDYNNSDWPGIFGTPGTGGVSAGYYYCNINMNCAITEDWSLYMSVNQGSVSAHSKRGPGRADWTPHLYAYPVQFYAYWPVGEDHATHYQGTGPYNGADPHIYASTVFEGKASYEGSGNPGPTKYNLVGHPEAVVGFEPPDGMVKVNGEVFIHPGDAHAQVWLSGVVSYEGIPNTDGIWMPSILVTLDGLIIPAKYYPWARFDGGWQSLNRDGAEQDATGLHRMQGGWQRETNSQNFTDEQHVHRRGAFTWAQSPEYK